jgi:hypothetical protein
VDQVHFLHYVYTSGQPGEESRLISTHKETEAQKDELGCVCVSVTHLRHLLESSSFHLALAPELTVPGGLAPALSTGLRVPDTCKAAQLSYGLT